MDIQLEPGVYVIAVSGGVDSVALLNMLSIHRELRLVVAHFDHGIRPDSEQDRLFVQDMAERYGLPFVFDHGRLGPQASEADARRARYDFLQRVRQAAVADAIVTAHHQDDALETAIHHLLRGTGRRGLSSIYNNPLIRRPLLHLSKQQLMDYARENQLTWRDDPTNTDTLYTRNYIRHQIIPRFSLQQKQQLLELLEAGRSRDRQIDGLLASVASNQELDRRWFIGLPHAVAREVMAAWLRRQGISQFDRKLIEQLVQAAKTWQPGRSANVAGPIKMTVGQKRLALTKAER